MGADMKKIEEQFNAEKQTRLGAVQEADTRTEFCKKYDGKKVTILGSEWTIRVVSPYDERMNNIDCTGLCEAYTHEIYIKDRTALNDPKQYLNIEDFVRKVLRHEIIHATFFETGNSTFYEDEDLTETLAHLVPKMAKVMMELELM